VTSVAVKEWKSNTGQKAAKYGYVAFNNAEDAARAIAEGAHNNEIRALFLPNEAVYINLHQSKERRLEYLNSKKKWQGGRGMPNMDMFKMMPPFMGNYRRFPPYPQMFPQNKTQMPRQPKTGGMGGPQPQKPWGKGPKPQQQGAPTMQTKPIQQKPNIMPGQPQAKKPMDNKLPQQKPQPVVQTPAITVQSLRNKLNDFLALDQDRQRQILGELLFPRIKDKAGDVLAPKITGMLIDLSVLEVTEILEFLEDPTLLEERVTEAVQLIQDGNV